MDALEASNLEIAALAEYALKNELASHYPDLTRVAGELGVDVDVQNAQAIDTRFMQKVQRDGCPPSYGTYEACYCEALQAGEIKLPSALPQIDLTRLTREQQDSFDAASTPNIRKFFESQQEPVNVNRASEFLMTAGGRAKDTIMNRGQR